MQEYIIIYRRKPHEVDIIAHDIRNMFCERRPPKVNIMIMNCERECHTIDSKWIEGECHE